MRPALSIDQRRTQAAAVGGPPPTVFDMRAMPGGRFVATVASVRMLVGYAFDVRDYQIEGGPNWASTDYFDIEASAGSEVTPAEIRQMLQQLLVERFRMRARLETREAPVHVLTVSRADGRLGPDLTRTPLACERQLSQPQDGVASGFPASQGGLPTSVPCGGMMMRTGPSGGTMAITRCDAPTTRYTRTGVTAARRVAGVRQRAIVHSRWLRVMRTRGLEQVGVEEILDREPGGGT